MGDNTTNWKYDSIFFPHQIEARTAKCLSSHLCYRLWFGIRLHHFRKCFHCPNFDPSFFTLTLTHTKNPYVDRFYCLVMETPIAIKMLVRPMQTNKNPLELYNVGNVYIYLCIMLANIASRKIKPFTKINVKIVKRKWERTSTSNEHLVLQKKQSSCSSFA